jgi:hypothetical protein
VPELRRVLRAFAIEKEDERLFALHWSWWRRQHQAKAKKSHYRRHGFKELPVKVLL